jgi:chromosome segregation ATPase
MTAINKYRVVGTRYKQQTRIYKDEVFQFSSDEGPQNAIITAKNTFGKGVLLQLLFQPMIPKTSWSRGKNKVNHFFYASKGQFKPYTFYSCIDFHLDLGRHLLVGVAMTSQLNEKNDCEPLYTLFVREYGYRLYDPFTIDNIPLYNKEKGAPTPYSEFLEYLRVNKKEFLVFNENSKSKFYSTLDSYGIIKKDWEQLIDINQYEGGVAYYFDDKNATTNHGLFSKMIIPAIEARLNEKGEESDLITLFKNIASITKNLPELKKNASAYAEIKNHNEEVYLSLSELIKEREKFDIHIEKGRSILTALSNEISSLEKETNDHKEQLVELNRLKQELDWKRRNLQYVIKHYELNDVNASLLSFGQKQNDKEQQKVTLTNQKDEAELQLQLKKWDEVEQELQNIRRKINAIEQSQDYRESKEQQIQLEVEIESEWNAVLMEINRISTESEAYKNHILKLRESINEQVKSYNKQLLNYEVDEGIIKKSIQKFEAELEMQKEIYGEHFFYDMDKIHSQKTKELKNCENKHLKLTKDQNEKVEELASLDRRHTTLEAEVKSDEKEVNRVKQQWEQQNEKEIKIMNKVWNVLRTNPVEVGDFRKWLIGQAPVLKNRKSEWDLTLNQLNIQLYEVAFEVKQNDKPYLIPSEEVYKVKSLLVEKGVPVLYGDEYIKQQEQAKREELNKKHPLLKYGLLVPNQNKAYVDEIKKLDKEFFHIPIPIFWVNQLDKPSDMQFTILDHKAAKLSIHDDKLSERKQELYSKSDEVKSEINNTKAYIDQLTTVVAELESFDHSNTSVELEKQYHTLQAQSVKKIKEKSDIKKQVEIVNKELENIAAEIVSITNMIESLKEEIESLKTWIEYKNIYESEKQKQFGLSLKIQSMNSKIGTKQNELSTLNDDFEDWKESHRDWRSSKNSLVEKVNEVLPKVYVEDVRTEALQDTQPNFTMDVDKLKEYMYKWKAVQQEMESRNTELVKLGVNLEHFQKAVHDEEKELSRLVNEWKKFRVPQEPIPVLKKRLEQKKESVNEIKDALLLLKSDIKHANSQKERLEKELNEMKASIFRDCGKQPEIWKQDDFSKTKNDIQHSINENKNDINDTNAILKDLENKVSNFNSIFQKLNATLNTLNISSGLNPTPYVQEIVKKDPVKTGDEWIKTFMVSQKNVTTKKSAAQSIHRKKKEVFERSEWVLEIKDVALKVYSDMDFEELQEVKASIEGLDLLASNEIAEAEEERNTAEEAKKEWVEHACKYALQIVEHLRKMIKAMRINNRSGLNFPLVKLKRDNSLPKETDQIKGNIDDLFDRVITEIFAEYQDVNDIPQKVFKEMISTKNIIFAAFNYQYPILWLYRLHEENSFLYEPPKEEFYTEWETINESSKTDPSGSGGQLFSARTLILMMLTSFKRTNEDNSNWKLLITDNPFSVAVSDHIVDPILAIAEELKFQWIVVTPPELVKVELLQKFDMYYQLSAKPITSGTDQVVSEVQYGYRNYKKSNSILKEKVTVYDGQNN